MHPTLRCLKTSALALTLTAGLSFAASAQVAVYDLDFEKAERSINFSFFDGGYFVLDGLTGTGSFIFTYNEVRDGRRQPLYARSIDSAEAFTAVKGDTRKTVVRATATTETGLAHYLAFGSVNDQITANNRGQRITIDIARSLWGHVLASDDESDVQFEAGDQNIGFAGISTFDLRLDPDRTREANRTGDTASEALARLIEELEALGFVDDSDDGEEDTGSGDDDGTTDSSTTDDGSGTSVSVSS